MMPVLPLTAGGKRPAANAFSIDSLMGKDSFAASASAKATNAAAAAAAAAAAVPGLAYGSFGHTLLKNIYETHYLESMGFAAGHLGISPAFAGALPPGACLSAHSAAAAGGGGMHASMSSQAAAFNPMLLGAAAQARAADHLLLNPWLVSRHGSHGFFGSRFGPADPSLLLQPFRKPKRIRTAFSPSQLLKLEQSFEKNHYVVGQERKDLATSLGLSETQVKVWFQNRRTKHKRTKSDGTVDNSENDDKDDAASNESEDFVAGANDDICDDDDGDEDFGGGSGDYAEVKDTETVETQHDGDEAARPAKRPKVSSGGGETETVACPAAATAAAASCSSAGSGDTAS